MTLNLVQNKKSKYEVVKILGTQTDPNQNCLKVLKLVRVKKQPRITMPAFINLDDDDKEKVIEISDSDNENESNDVLHAAKDFVPLSFGDLVQNSTSNESKLIISSVTSARYMSANFKDSQIRILSKSVPAVISITTDKVNNTNIYEEIEKIKKSLSENSNCFVASDSSKSSSQNASELNSSETSMKNYSKMQQIEVNPNFSREVLNEIGQVNIIRAKRNKKVPQKLLDGENYKPLVMKLKLSETQDTAKPSQKRKQYEIIAPEKPQKIRRKSGKLIGTTLQFEKAPASSNAKKDENKIAEESKQFKPYEVKNQPQFLNYQVHKTIMLPKIDASKYEMVKESDLKSYKNQEHLKKSPVTNQGEKSRIETPTVQNSDSQLRKINLNQMKENSEILSNIKSMNLINKRSNEAILSRQPHQMLKEKQNFICMLNLQSSKSNDDKLKTDPEGHRHFQFPPTPPTSPEDSVISSPKVSSPSGSYITKLKCHKTCSNSKAHNRKHKVDISSTLGQLLTKRDVINEAYIRDSLKRMEEFTKTPIFDRKTNSFIDPLQSSKKIRALKGKVGRKSEVNNVLAHMKDSGIERNFMRRGTRVKTFVQKNIKEEIL